MALSRVPTCHMKILRAWGFALGGALLMLSACSDSDGGSGGGSSAALCGSYCLKLEECGLTTDKPACETQCNKGTASSGCTASSAQMSACQRDFEAAECADLSSGVMPASCKLECGSGGAGGGGGSGGSTSSGTCSDLAGCCSNLPDADARDGCSQLAASGDETNCSAAYTGLKSASYCD